MLCNVLSWGPWLFHLYLLPFRSICLLVQVSLPCLLYAPSPSQLVLKGGTNAEMAPQIDYMTEVHVPETFFSAEVPWRSSWGDGEQARAMNILEDWGRERWARADLREGAFSLPFALGSLSGGESGTGWNKCVWRSEGERWKGRKSEKKVNVLCIHCLGQRMI